VVPAGADISQPDQQDVRHRMDLLSGFGSARGGWTVLPRITTGEMFNDNIFQVDSPRHWDFTTFVAPGVGIVGDTSRLQLRVDYQPTLNLNVKEGSQNTLTQQLNADGLVTIVPDLFFVDVRGVAGTQANEGGIGGMGGLGQTGISPITANGISSTGEFGLSKQNLSQTATFAVSPYMLYHFGNIGVGKLGVSVTHSSSAEISGFAPLPFAGGGTDSETQSNVEETASFNTGDHFGAIRDTVSLDAGQGEFSGQFGGRSSWGIAYNRVDYAISHRISVYGTAGWEDIDYSGANRLSIHDAIWGFGTTVTPNKDSRITIGYGHVSGRNSLTFSGYYALTARTTLTASYSNTLGTQLEQVAGQLDQGAVDNNGGLVNAETGAPLFVGSNALGLASGIFRFSTLTFGVTTTLDRDVITLRASNSSQTQIGVGAPSTTDTVQVFTANWSRQLTPRARLNTTLSYSMGTPTAALGRTQSLAASISLQYALSETVSTFASYVHLDRETRAQGGSFYENITIAGITKHF
jgi:uncharacterized protein (PEP-CTERM system associated)